jgi:hypothetical protein
MRALAARAVAAFTDAVLAESFPFLDTEQRASTASFVIDRWQRAAQPVHLGIGATATLLRGAVWAAAAVRGSDEEREWRGVVRQSSRHSLPLVSELAIFVSSLATAYASERWPRAAVDGQWQTSSASA